MEVSEKYLFRSLFTEKTSSEQGEVFSYPSRRLGISSKPNGFVYHHARRVYHQFRRNCISASPLPRKAHFKILHLRPGELFKSFCLISSSNCTNFSISDPNFLPMLTLTKRFGYSIIKSKRVFKKEKKENCLI